MTRRSWCRGILLLGLACVLAAHRPLLTQMARWWIAPASPVRPTVAAVLGGDRRYAVAVERLRAGELRKILLFESEPGRLQQLGIIPRDEQIGRSQLLRAGATDAEIEIIAGRHRHERDVIRTLDTWLIDHPSDTIGLYYARFASRRLALLCDRYLAPQRRHQVVVIGLPDRRYDETNWWRSRMGLKDFFASAFHWSYVFLRRGEEPRRVHLDADAYEALVLP